MSVPIAIRESMKKHLWDLADKINWLNLSNTERSRYYANWTREEDIGDILSQYMDLVKVRVFIKDRIMKGYISERSSDPKRCFRILGIEDESMIIRNFKNPSGVILKDGRLICWGRAAEWKSILLSTFERCYEQSNLKSHAIVFFGSFGLYKDLQKRTMIEAAGNVLSINKIVWVDI